MGPEHRSLDYNVGALVIFVISIGLVVIVHAGRNVPFSLFDLPTWFLGPLGVCTFIFGPLGFYTLIYSFVGRKEFTYYLVWGTIMFSLAVISTLYSILNPFIVVGVVMIILAVIGLVAYLRGKK